MNRLTFFSAFVFLACIACDDNNTITDTENNLIMTLGIDETLPRLGNIGQPVSVPTGHAAQNPRMKEVSLHYIELAPTALTALGDGEIIYQGKETTAGGERAVDFNKALKGQNGDQLLSTPLNNIKPGTYEWVRVSLTYQNYEVDYLFNSPPYVDNKEFTGTIASFVGFNTFITEHTVGDSSLVVNGNKKQGYWAFETSIDVGNYTYNALDFGDGAGVTVVNPINATSPIPAGSCVVTGKLKEPLVITGDETTDREMLLNFSINNSFEWKEVHVDGKFEPLAGETIVDMGLRGLHPEMVR